MKRVFGIVLLVALLVTMLVGCGKFKCDLCQKEKSGKKHNEEILGQEVVYCDDCYNGLKGIADALGDLG